MCVIALRSLPSRGERTENGLLLPPFQTTDAWGQLGGGGTGEAGGFGRKGAHTRCRGIGLVGTVLARLISTLCTEGHCSSGKRVTNRHTAGESGLEGSVHSTTVLPFLCLSRKTQMEGWEPSEPRECVLGGGCWQ